MPNQPNSLAIMYFEVYIRKSLLEWQISPSQAKVAH